MFALTHDNKALCLEDYGNIKKGGIVPRVNELWREVEEWLLGNDNKWESMPEEPVKDHNAIRLKNIENQRLIAYADPITGSDRYLSESARLEALGDSVGATEAREKAVERYYEIQKEFPYELEAQEV